MASWFNNTRVRLQQGGRLLAGRVPPEPHSATLQLAAGHLAPPPATALAPMQPPVAPVPALSALRPGPRVTLATVVASATCVLSDLDPGGEATIAGPHSLSGLARHAAAYLASLEQQVAFPPP